MRMCPLPLVRQRTEEAGTSLQRSRWLLTHMDTHVLSQAPARERAFRSHCLKPGVVAQAEVVGGVDSLTK